MPLYLLDCDCGHQLEVDPGRAGESMPCPQCDAVLQVPSLRELKQLPVAGGGDAAADPKRRRRAAPAGAASRGVTQSLGVILLFLSLVAIGLLVYVRYQSVSGLAKKDFIIDGEIRIERMSALETLQLWSQFQELGMGTREGSLLRTERRRIRVLYVLMGVAGAVSLVALSMIVFGGKPRSSG